MPNEIDPVEVIFDFPAAENKTQREPVAPDKVKIDPFFSPTKKQFSRIREAFTSDPLAVFENEGDRARLELESSRMPDPENFRKRYALAAYYSQMQNSDFKFVLANLDQFTAKYNNGKPQTVEAAYHDIAAHLAPQQEGELAQHGHSLLSGLARIPATLWNLHAKASRWGLDLQTEILKPLMSEEDYRWNKDYARLSEDIQRGVARNFEEISVEEAKKSGANPEFVTDLLAGRFDQVSPYDFTKALLQSAPDMSLQLLIGMANPWAVPAYVTATSGVNKAYELEENHPEIQGAAKYTNIGVTAVTQGLLDLVTARIMGGGFSKEQAAEAVKKGLLKYLGKSFAEEAATESAQQLGENLTDLFTGVYGDIGEMSLDEKMGHIFRGVPESGFVGGMYGPVFGYRGYRNLKAMDQYRMQVRTRLEAERERILQKDALTSADMATLARINEKLDAGNLNDLASVEFETELRQEIEGQQEEKPEVQATPEFREVERTAWDGATEEDIQQAVEAEKHQRLLQKLPHNPQDTIDAVVEASREFRSVRFNIAMNPDDYPAAVIAEAERRFGEKRVPKAFYDDGEVWIDASRVRPSEVPKKIMHEVAGHKGLRMLFPDNAELNALFDNVYREHYRDADFNKIAELYFPDHILPGETDPETGETAPDMVSLETVEDQRYAADEFIAQIAESKGVKPNWWKEFLQSLRMWIAKNIPFCREVRMTDREIEILLARSARAMRRGRRESEVSGRDGIRFAAALRREGAPNAAENPGQLRDGNVPHKKGFPESAGLPGERFYADYEFLYGKHPEYFDDVEHVRAAVEFVLNDPEPAGTIGGNLAFVRADESIGKYYRIEVKPTLTAKRHHIRSVHELTAEQYLKAKSATLPGTTTVTKPTHRQASKVSDFLRYNIDDSDADIKPENAENQENSDIRFSLADDPESGKAFPKRHAGNYNEALNNLRSLQGQTFVNADTGIEARLSANGVNKLLSNKAREKSYANGFTYAQHFEAVSNIDRLFENAVLAEERADHKGSADIASVKRFSAPFYTGREFAEAYLTVKEFVQHGHRIYSLELEEIKKPPAGKATGGSPDQTPRPSDGTPSDADAEGTRHNPAAEGYKKPPEVKTGVRPDQHTRPSDGTPSDTDAEGTRHNPAAEGYNSKLLEKIEKSRQLLEKEAKKSDPDIRFSIIGERGAANAENASMQLANLETARKMFDAGKRMSVIRRSTGWEKGADGKWRTESRDNWSLSEKFAELETRPESGPLPLPEAIEQTELFRLYPELREVRVQVSDRIHGGSYNPGEKLITVGETVTPKLVLIHEIQHAIQDIEGFSPGGTPEQFMDLPSLSAFEQYHRLAGEIEARNAEKRTPMPHEKKMQTLLAATEDVAPEDKLYLSRALSGEFDIRFAVNAKGETIFGIAGRPGNLTAREIIEDSSIGANTPVLTSEGSEAWGEITPGMAAAAPELGLEVLPIKMLKGRHRGQHAGFGLAHVYEQHGAELEARGYDLAEYLTGIFSRPNQIYVSKPGDAIRLELVTKSKPRNIGVLELRKENGFYSVVTAFPIDQVNYTPKGKQVWQYTASKPNKISQEGSSVYQPASSEPAPLTRSAPKNAADTARVSRSKPDFNITDSDEKSSSSGDESIRFSVAQYSEADRDDIIAMLKPYAGIMLDRDGADYAAYLAAKGVNIPAEDARIFALEATRENMKTARERAAKRRNDWLYKNVPVWQDVVSVTGSENFKIVPSKSFRDEEMSGTFIAKKKETGMPSDELAQAIARRSGRDPLTVEQEIIDFFRDLKKPDLYKMYSDWKKENLLGDRELDRKMREEYKQWQQQEKEAGHAAAGEPEAAYEKFAEKLREFKEKVLAAKADAMKLQRDALSFAEKHLPPENRGEFTRAIVKLMEYPSAPSARYPEGRRAAEFRKIFENILARSRELRRGKLLEMIAKRLNQLGDRVDASRKVRGLRDMETQARLNRIIAISRMDSGMLDMEIAAKQKAIESALSDGRDVSEMHYDIALCHRYGMLWEKSADELETAWTDLNELARTGKNRLLVEIQKRANDDERDRNEWHQAVNGMKRLDPVQMKVLADRRARRWKILDRIDSEFWRGLSLDGILEAAALFSDSDEKNVLGRFREMAHTAKQKKDTMNLKNAADCRAELARLLKTDSSVKIADTVLQWRRMQDKSGVFRFVPDPGEKQFKYHHMEVEEARSALAAYDTGEKKLSDFEAEAIRHQLRTLDLKVKYDVPEEFRDGATDRLMKMIQEEADKQETPEIVIPVPTRRGASRELPLTQLQALYLKLLWDQKDIRYKMHFNGYSDETMTQIDQFLLPEVKEFGKWMRSELERDRNMIDRTYQALYYSVFPHEEFYFPSVYEPTHNSIGSDAVDLSEPGSGARAHSYTPGALKVRVYHLKEPKIADALTVFQNHRLQMNHFVTHAEAARKLRSVLLNADIKNAIISEHGTAMYRELKDALADFINGGNKDVDTNSLYAHLYSNAVRTKMAFNLTSGMKQTLGFITYIQEIPAPALFRGMAYAATHPGEVMKVWAGTDYIRNRWENGSNSDMRLLLDAAGRDAGKANAMLDKLDRFSSLPLRFGDAAASIIGGFAVYQYHFDKLKTRGLSTMEARKQALLKAEMATERTQQSSAPFMLNRYQRGSWAERSVTTFLSNQILLWNHFAPRIYKAAHYKTLAPVKGASGGIAALILSSAAMTAFDQMKEHWKDGEYEWWDYLWNTLADGICGAGPCGWLLNQAIGAWKPGGYGRSSNLVLGDVVRSGYSFKKIAAGDAEISDNDWKAAVDILTAFGYFIGPAAQAGAIGREARKWWRIFGNNN